MIRESVGAPAPEPDTIRLRYKEELGEAVREIVRSETPPNHDALRNWGRKNGVAAEDLEAFTERGVELLRNLNEGTAGRYRLSLEELRSWQEEIAQLS